MTREEIISGLQMTMDLIQFDPGTGNVRPIYELNDLDKTTYVACKEAIKALKAQGTCEDAVSRQTLQKELALYPIDDVTSEDEAGYNRAINDVQKMVLHLPSAQPEPLKITIDPETTADELERIKHAMRNTPVMLLLSEQPEIIRCRDCKYWREHKYAKETKRYIPFCGFNAIYTKADDFCSRAERRTE